ncbi:MAG: hypothetical protein LBT53_01065 [Puniceicoccales bacterium]|nr:hypothetical protein [Puniceicoccales bacterium]
MQRAPQCSTDYRTKGDIGHPVCVCVRSVTGSDGHTDKIVCATLHAVRHVPVVPVVPVVIKKKKSGLPTPKQPALFLSILSRCYYPISH